MKDGLQKGIRKAKEGVQKETETGRAHMELPGSSSWLESSEGCGREKAELVAVL